MPLILGEIYLALLPNYNLLCTILVFFALVLFLFYPLANAIALSYNHQPLFSLPI